MIYSLKEDFRAWTSAMHIAKRRPSFKVSRTSSYVHTKFDDYDALLLIFTAFVRYHNTKTLALDFVAFPIFCRVFMEYHVSKDIKYFTFEIVEHNQMGITDGNPISYKHSF